MPHARIHLHFVWATHLREPLLTTIVEAEVHRLIRAKARRLGASCHAVNGTADHVHMVVSLPPRLAPASFIGWIKGFSSREISRTGLLAFRWQREYGVFSLGSRELPSVIDYVRRQKEHHEAGDLIAPLEMMCERPAARP